MRKEAVVDQLSVLSRHLLSRTAENYKIFGGTAGLQAYIQTVTSIIRGHIAKQSTGADCDIVIRLTKPTFFPENKAAGA